MKPRITPASGILRRAADLIEQPGKWTRHSLARNARGKAVRVHSPTAESFCAIGAISKVAGRGVEFATLRRVARRALQREMPLILTPWSQSQMDIDVFNDASAGTGAEVAAKMREAAQKLEAAE